MTVRSELVEAVITAARAWRSRTDVRQWHHACDTLMSAVDALNHHERDAPTTVEALPDDHRLLLLVLINRAWVDIKDDPDMVRASQECEDIIRRLGGPDTHVTVERVHPSGAS